METEKQITTEAVKKVAKWKIAAIAGAGLVVSVSTWAGLTKAGYIPNFLGLQSLYTEDGSNASCPSGQRIIRDCFNIPNQDTVCTEWKCGPIEMVFKPVIYLYPTEKTDVKVQLDYQGKLIADYPEYDYSIKGWEVVANPDSTLINKADNKQYSYLFWEGIPSEPTNYDLSKGFLVKGEETREFLQNKLTEIGLTPKEYNEFIVYWYPLMKDNKYNLIHFAGKDYTDTAPLTITPTPDSMLRVFMVFKPLDQEVEIEEQKIQPFDRKGFAVVEWGGTELK